MSHLRAAHSAGPVHVIMFPLIPEQVSQEALHTAAMPVLAYSLALRICGHVHSHSQQCRTADAMPLCSPTCLQRGLNLAMSAENGAPVGFQVSPPRQLASSSREYTYRHVVCQAQFELPGFEPWSTDHAS